MDTPVASIDAETDSKKAVAVHRWEQWLRWKRICQGPDPGDGFEIAFILSEAVEREAESNVVASEVSLEPH